MKHINFSLTLVALALVINVNANAQYNADNTAQNRRDRNGETLTPQDQSNRVADIKLTAKLRRAIMAEKGLSNDAQNIKIIDRKGCVVLRGPVDSVHEKNTIDCLAEKCCGANYKNELEIKAVR